MVELSSDVRNIIFSNISTIPTTHGTCERRGDQVFHEKSSVFTS